MSVVIRSGDLENVLGSLQVFSRRPIPGATSLKVARIHGAASAAFKDFMAERQSLVMECVERDDKGEPVTVPGDRPGMSGYKLVESRVAEFNSRVAVIEDDVVELSVKKLTETEIRAIDIEPQALVHLLQFIENIDGE